MKVLHIVNKSAPLPGGYVNRLENIIKNIKQDFNIIVLTSHYSYDYEILDKENIAENKDIRRYHTLSKSFFIYTKKIRKYAFIRLVLRRIDNFVFSNYIKQIIKIESPDIIHGHSQINIAYIAYKIAKKYQLPFLYDIHAFTHDGSNIRKKVEEKRIVRKEKQLLENAANIVVLCKSQQNYIAEEFHIPVSKFTVCYNGVNRKVFYKISHNEDTRQKYNFKKEDYIVAINASKPGEGAENFFRIIDELFSVIRNLKIIIFGAHKSRHKKNHEDLNHDKIVIFDFLNQHELNELYNIIDLFIIPRVNTKQNQTIVPLKHIELMSAGTIVLVSNVGGLTEQITDNYNGFVFKDFTSKSLMEKIVAIKNMSKEKIDNISKNAVLTAEKYNWEKNVWKLKETYSELLLK